MWLPCSAWGCRYERSSGGLCITHLRRKQRHGDPEIGGRLPRAEVIRLRRLVHLDDTGPTETQIAQWIAEEGVDELEVAV
jgi:hypothetical protein